MDKQSSKILIVDDISKNIQTLANILKESGFALSFARSGKDALSVIEKQIPDLILLDVVMPEMDGFELCQKIKSYKKYEEIPIIFLTVKKDTNSIIKGFKCGGADYVSKPFNQHELIARINTHLKLSHNIKENRKKDKILFQKSRVSMLSELIKNISHQWRQPLTTLGLYNYEITEQLNEKKFDKKNALEFLDKSDNLIQDLSKIINNFAKYFRPQKNKQLFSINDTIDNTLGMDKEINSNNIQIIKNFPNKQINLNSFEGEFAQVLFVLLSNAKDSLIKKTDGEKIIYISLEKIKNEIILNIHDNGDGIDESIMDKIFDPYTTTKHQAVGVGLGLYMVKTILQNHMLGDITAKNSEFEVDGKIYHGACFTISFKITQ